MKPVPDDMSTSFAWPPYNRSDAQWYQISMRDYRQILAWYRRDHINLPKDYRPTHAEFLAYSEPITERQRFGNFIHMRIGGLADLPKE